jgi:2-haloacid dehalogenase
VIRGYVFDAYGTLFDVHSVVEAGRRITGDPLALSMAWRQKQLEELGFRADIVVSRLDQLPL